MYGPLRTRVSEQIVFMGVDRSLRPLSQTSTRAEFVEL